MLEKPKNVQNLKDFSEKQWAILTPQEKQKTHEQLSKNNSIMYKAYTHFWMKYSNCYKFSYYFVLWIIYKHILCKRILQDRTK